MYPRTEATPEIDGLEYHRLNPEFASRKRIKVAFQKHREEMRTAGESNSANPAI